MAGEELMKIPMDDIPEGVNVLQLHSMDGGDKNKHATEMEEELHGHGHGHSHSSSHMDMGDHLNPSVIVTFTMKDLKPGKTLPIYFDKRDPAYSPPSWLPKEEAESIPFSSAHLPYLLELFSFSPGSTQAEAMAQTIGFCENKPREGETKFCATSQESLLDSLHTYFGPEESHFRALSTSYLTKSTTLLQNYTILEVPKIKEIPAHPKMIACHTMPYPYLIYYCHFPGAENKVFEVSLQGQNGDRVDAFSVCHLDTSSWSPGNVVFRSLGFQHGDAVCHFFPEDNLIWVPN